jgi:pantoate--beta-alanine ligase
MRIIESLEEMVAYSNTLKKEYSIGFVPTMGYLHEGHLSLCEESKKNCDKTIASIFVNPTQFGKNEDLSTYPTNLERDFHLLESIGVDAVFLPTNEIMYPSNYHTWVTVDELTNVLCGASRPTHFRGVTTIVTKLINIVNPDFMFMGEKDFQQVAVLRQMVLDLNMRVKIISCPLVREQDGLAMSSRNSYLNEQQRSNAISLFKSLNLAKNLIYEGETSVNKIIAEMEKLIQSFDGEIDYISIRNEETLQEETKISDHSRAFLAVYYGKTRLIDNMKL